jgi:hypothetical protein
MIRFGKVPLRLSVCSRPGCGEQPTAPVGSDAWSLASEVADAPTREDLTGERPTVAISIDVEHWAATASLPSAGRTRIAAAVCCGLRVPCSHLLTAVSAALLTVACCGEAW